MKTISSLERIRQKLNVKKYLVELSALVGHAVQADELTSLDQATAIREAAQKFKTQSATSIEIAFSDRRSKRFIEFLQKLHYANPCPVYIWTPRTMDCGALLVPSIGAVRFEFDFTLNEEGIVVFLTSDLTDRLLLDFSVTATGVEVMKVETQGMNWERVELFDPK